MLTLCLARGLEDGYVMLQLPATPADIGEAFAELDNISADAGSTLIRDALKVPNWSRTIVLETSCCFEKLKNLAEQYDSVEQLITDANNFTYICEEAGQGAYCFTEHLQAAMALENCTELAHALDISQNLHCYDFLPCEEHWEKFGHYIARRSGIISEGSALSPYFDYAAYAATEIERLHLAPCDNGYIHRNEKEFRYEYSTPSIEPQGMQMGR